MMMHELSSYTKVALNSRKEFHEMERYYITDTKDCVDQMLPGRIRKERGYDNRQRIAEWSKQYKEQNSEHIKQYALQYRQAHRD